MADPQGRLMNINIPYPNPVLTAVGKSPEGADFVERATVAVFNIYQANLPVRTGNLRRQAFHYIAMDGWGEGEKDRWFGYVGNRAVYAGAIEYGRKTKRGGRVAGQHQLREAFNLVFGHVQHGIDAPDTGVSSPRRYSRADRNPKTGVQNFRNRKGSFTKSPTR